MKVGAIKKVTIENFVTYSNVEMYPGPNLNIILGPNGTGKSTILAAIILGLGGTPKTIGRGTKVSEYVKHGCTEAKIDIELQGTAVNSIMITRIFNLNNQNKWYINNKNVSENQVKNLMTDLNIQINNLCQFLPQDRVQDFSKMNKKELLINTQKAVGRQDLIDKFTSLIEIKDKQKNFAQNIEAINKKLEISSAVINRLMGKVENLFEKKRILEQIQCVKRKIAWESYNKFLKKLEIVDKLKLQAGETLSKCKTKIQPVENRINKVRVEIADEQKKLLQIRKQIACLENTFKTLLETNEDIEYKMKNVITEMNSKLQVLLEYENEVTAMKVKLDKLSNDEKALVLKYGDVSEMNKIVETFDSECNLCNMKSEECNKQRISALKVVKKSDEKIKELEYSLKQMENIKEKRLLQLQKRDQDAYNAVLWLRENKHIFSGEVYEPIMLELNVINSAHAKYLENMIPMKDRVAFTCENREDMNYLLQQVRDQLGLRINVVHSGNEHPPLSYYRPQIPIEQLRKYGFFAYITSLITGPESILKYLCRMYNIHNIPIGDKSTHSKADQITDKLRLYFSESHRFAVAVSRYTNEKSTRISDVISDGTFSICLDYSIMNNLKRELEEKISNHKKIQMKMEMYDSQRQVFESKRTEALQKRQNVLQCKEQIEAVRGRIQSINQKLQQHRNGQKTEQQIRQEANETIKLKLVPSSIKLQNQMYKALTKIQSEIEKEHKTNLEYNIMQQQIIHMENEIVDLRKEYEEVENAHRKTVAVHQKMVAETSEAKRNAKKLSDGHTPDDKDFEQFREAYNKLPKDIDALNNLINEFQTKLECILTVDVDELEVYENAQQEHKECQEQLQNKETTLRQYNIEIKTLFDEWMDPLIELINKINKNFGAYFESMGCAGEVAISNESGVEEYIDYGLCIRVKYRAGEPLQQLNRFVQSGGERTVATAVYMLSLQDLTPAPFRCVDEINQGMDPQNERRIFEILVSATTKTKDICQYFLITPKLISGIQFGNDMKIHIVHNGPYC